MYFYRENEIILQKDRLSVLNRKNRYTIPGLLRVRFIEVGDILEIIFSRNNTVLTFEGVCICIRKRKLLSFNCSFILRNVIMRVGIEVVCMLYANMLLFNKLHILHYKRKRFNLKSNKIYFIRFRLNRESCV